jgi:hypothetical protein
VQEQQPSRQQPALQQVGSSGLMLPAAGADLDLLVDAASSSAAAGAAGGLGDGVSSGGGGMPAELPAELLLDWKGEPMKINPGDKLPFKFL